MKSKTFFGLPVIDGVALLQKIPRPERSGWIAVAMMLGAFWNVLHPPAFLREGEVAQATKEELQRATPIYLGHGSGDLPDCKEPMKVEKDDQVVAQVDYDGCVAVAPNVKRVLVEASRFRCNRAQIDELLNKKADFYYNTVIFESEGWLMPLGPIKSPKPSKSVAIIGNLFLVQSCRVRPRGE